jgi:hypothetical protein
LCPGSLTILESPLGGGGGGGVGHERKRERMDFRFSAFLFFLFFFLNKLILLPVLGLIFTTCLWDGERCRRQRAAGVMMEIGNLFLIWKMETCFNLFLFLLKK